MLRVMSQRSGWVVYGSLRTENERLKLLAPNAILIHGVTVEKEGSLIDALKLCSPEIVVNCVGLVKQAIKGGDPLEAIPLNSLFPHRLAKMCELLNARLIHISTDCVFSGFKGNYAEHDIPDAVDVYGRSKLLGEVDSPGAITLRTSIIGHELYGARSLIDWFLSQQGSVRGYSKAIFSGLPTCELARVICDYVIPNPSLHGIYHVAATPITKYELLELVRREYGKNILITPDESIEIDRSLNSSRFTMASGYVAPSWKNLIESMHKLQ